MKILSLLTGALALATTAIAQVNSGSNGSDGALNPTSDLVIDMADHPDGIYHYTSVNIPAGVTVSFIPNAANTPVVWLAQQQVLISGSVNLNGHEINFATGQPGGPGGFAGGAAPAGGNPPHLGQGPGGGGVDPADAQQVGGNAAYGLEAATSGHPSGSIYGNKFLLPLMGGSGGSGGYSYGYSNGGGGGGGAMLIASSAGIRIDGSISANGGGAPPRGEQINFLGGGGASGGAIRLVAQLVEGSGSISVSGGLAGNYANYGTRTARAGGGRIRIDAFENRFNGSSGGAFSTGFQPIIIPAEGQGLQLNIAAVADVDVSATPTGQLTSPDVIIPANQQNPVSIVVRCTNIPLNTEIIVDVTPANGATVRATGLNTAGTQASSTATVNVTMPRGGGTIQAKAVSGLNLTASLDGKPRSIAESGWTADGERFAKVEVTATLGGAIRLACLTESGKRYALPTR